LDIAVAGDAEMPFVFAAIMKILKIQEAGARLIVEDNLAKYREPRDLQYGDMLEFAAQVCDSGEAANLEDCASTVTSKRREADEWKAHLRESRNGKIVARRKPVKFPGRQTWEASDAETLAPPGARFYRDEHQKRWQVWFGRGPYGARWSCSRSWGLHGDDGKCVEELLKQVWGRHQDLYGGEGYPYTS
jgi:hypothetical protein